MTHEPECDWRHRVIEYGNDVARCVQCDALRAAYRRGWDESNIVHEGENKAYEQGYRAGYNAHAESRAYLEQVYGPYKPKRLIDWIADGSAYEAWFNQHGKGENP